MILQNLDSTEQFRWLVAAGILLVRNSRESLYTNLEQVAHAVDKATKLVEKLQATRPKNETKQNEDVKIEILEPIKDR